MKNILFSLFLFLLPFTPALGQEEDPYAKKIAKASDDAQKAIKKIQVPKGLQVDLWAAEPMLANPIAFCIDEKGRIYVAETFRVHKGVTDNRNQNWTDDDLAARTVADRLAYYKKHHGKKYDSMFAVEQDRVRLLEDTKGLGKADKSTVFSDGYNKHEDGLGSGVLARGGKVWYTNIPALYLLEDTKGAGKADIKKALHTGFGIHSAFIGHDLHGLIMGPDGKIYFSIGDRGLRVEAEGKVFNEPDWGSVLRCNPDGSELEVVHKGLRNPQELAFDEWGNLFTGDNNADGGDAARWVHIIEGGDTGWRLGYQYLPSLGIWNSEKIWHMQHTYQPANLLPPLAHIGSGPSGLTYHPGVTSLPEKYAKHFFMCDFRGNAGGSAIHSFAVKAKGATFEVTDQSKFMTSLLVTDCDFGPDGSLYMSDWIDGWGLPNKGRIYKISDPSKANDTALSNVKNWLAEGFSKKSGEELAKLLEHADMRIRREAQFALVEQGAGKTLNQVAAAETRPLIARIHAIWGLGQLGRKKAEVLASVVSLLKDPQAEVRAQSAKVLGAAKVESAGPGLIGLLKDGEPRVRLYAGLALARIGTKEAFGPIAQMLKENQDKDTYLRHAGVMALAGCAGQEQLLSLVNDSSPSVRLGALLALRRSQSSEVARFLKDADPRVLLETARAIYDTPINSAMPELAKSLVMMQGQNLPKEVAEPILFRVLAAHYRIKTPESADILAKFAGQSQANEKLRLDAMKWLSQWEKPSDRDPVVGLWRPMQPGSGQEVAQSLQTNLASIMTGSDKIRKEGAALAGKFGIKEVGPLLRKLVGDSSRPVSVRIASLDALANLKDAQLETLVQSSLKDEDPLLRHKARQIHLGKMKPADAAPILAEVLEKGAMVERQGAFALLADLKANPADAILLDWLNRDAKAVPAEIHLDLSEAARKRGTPELKKKLDERDAKLPNPKEHLTASYLEAKVGGNAEAGRKVFFERTELSCLRCHKVQGIGGDVGPDLTGIGKKVKRDYLLESLVEPNKQIAKGYDSVLLALTDGRVVKGILKAEDAKEVRLMNAEGQIFVIQKSQIEERNRDRTAMPEDLIKKMSRFELRDLVEYLSGL